LPGARPAAGPPAGILTGLLAHDDIQVWRYADDGPPPGTPELRSPWSALGYPIGWIVASPAAQPGELISHNLSWTDGEKATRSAIAGNVVQAAAGDHQSAAYTDLPVDGARMRRVADTVAASAANSLKADLYITERPYLHAATRSLVDGVTFCTPAQALALVSLYLRSQATFPIWLGTDGKGGETFSKGLFYWVGARELLPAGWRWYSACVAHDHARGADELTYLGEAVFQRVTRTLQARDDLLRLMNLAQNNDGRRERPRRV
jgi:hypothetical protein